MESDRETFTSQHTLYTRNPTNVYVNIVTQCLGIGFKPTEYVWVECTTQ